ncbi:MAG: TetR/AcrR family transcriptional regulator [Phenylobacterium sp.]|nr:TetR/AcrR family transcriptional regulator [Phenylobacterium sp.]
MGWYSGGCILSFANRRATYVAAQKDAIALPRAKGVKNADYEAKRRELLARMLPRFARLDLERPSLRQLAAAAEVTAPTLQHYFGDRTGVIGALLAEYRRRGEARLGLVSKAKGPFKASVREFSMEFVFGLQAQGPVRLGDVLAASLCEGLADPQVSPHALAFIVDPAVDSLVARLEEHIGKGEMIQTDVRAAALMLLSPLLLAVLHQDQMNGRDSRRIELNALADQVSQAFVRAYAARTPVPA